MDIMDIFGNIFGHGSIAPESFAYCVFSALLAGLILDLFCRKVCGFSRSLSTTIAVMPVIVAVVILVVNGNIGTGIAVAGAFSLVRFRSAPGSAKEIAFLFIAMAAGLLVGAGFPVYALLFTVIVGVINATYERYGFIRSNSETRKVLKVIVPASFDYGSGFNDLFARYAVESTLAKVKSTGKGDKFKLTYNLVLRADTSQKEMLDEIRSLNEGHEVSLSEPSEDKTGKL